MGLGKDLYRGRNDLDFPRTWRFTTTLSVVLVLISIASLVWRGLNLSIDFEGGSVWEVPASDFTSDDAGAVLADFGDVGERYQEATSVDGDRVLRISGRVDSVGEGTEVAEALADAAGLDPGAVTVNTVGPSWGDDITSQARTSLIVFLVLVGLYITWRLEARMAVAALLAVLHDVILTVGVYSVLQLSITPGTVISFLTILGFSLYDTIVVYDRVQENADRLGRTGQYTYIAVMRRSLNQVLMRSINTTVITVVPIVSLLVVGQVVFGQQTIADFSLALLIGLVSGTYSSLYIAAPLTSWLKEREPRWKEIRRRIEAKGLDVGDTSWRGVSTGGRRAPAPVVATAGAPARASGSTDGGDGSGGAPADPDESVPSGGTGAAAPPGSGPGGAPPLTIRPGGHPPRPRKKRR
jgi:preprotein translocase subunit SecF